MFEEAFIWLTIHDIILTVSTLVNNIKTIVQYLLTVFYVKLPDCYLFQMSKEILSLKAKEENE
ncbi:hypothetical protein CO123_02110 [bacterium (Candidatus Howlettbacteria) CG_4_9_14_3_um_filter_37_10]|nr:MAG: hypothetical protein COX25_04685 [bacterium (Candidatus Howlettbacteria) CG23_combo_of_CG06-09_8_20_14_all_37_9]PJB06475.1 MAG: hypothetical protein CO123_02110 [bacterium (Candidatus Howlettbacteria) CG_4_9_14_3_um_filter_37_10]